MKKIIQILLLLAYACSAIAQSTDAELTTQANVIRNETIPGANTPLRIGNMFRALIDSKKNIDEAYTSTGSPNTYSITINPGVTGFTKDFGFYWKVNATNTSTVTLAVNGLSAKAVRKDGSAPLASGDLVAGRMYPVIYDVAQGWFQVLLPGSGGGGSFTLTDGEGTTVSGSGTAVDLGGVISAPVVFDDVRATPLGLQYNADYSATFTNRSVPDKEYVDDAIAANPGVTDGDKGDITVTSSTTWTIDNLVVTPAKMSTFSSADMRGKYTDETGTGLAYFQGGDIGTPSAGVATNLTGTAVGLTAGTVTTNANLTGDVTSSGNATSIASGVIVDADVNASAAIAGTKLANTPAGNIAATTVQAAINELDGEKAALASPTFTGTPAAPTASAGTSTTQIATTAFVQASKNVSHNVQTGNYTAALTDAGNTVIMRSTSGQNFTVPAFGTVAFPEGTRITIVPDSTGQTTVVAAAGVNIETSSGTLLSAGQDSPMVLEKKNGANLWYLWNGTGGSFESGTFTPTLTNTANIAASTAYLCTYVRVDNTVTMSGRVDIDPTTTSTTTILGISLPVASAFTTANQGGGVAFAPGFVSDGAAILTDATNDRLTLQYVCTDVTNHAYYFTVTYQRIP